MSQNANEEHFHELDDTEAETAFTIGTDEQQRDIRSHAVADLHHALTCIHSALAKVHESPALELLQEPRALIRAFIAVEEAREVLRKNGRGAE